MVEQEVFIIRFRFVGTCTYTQEYLNITLVSRKGEGKTCVTILRQLMQTYKPTSKHFFCGGCGCLVED
jgi:hypothetical protein